jgi:hypothetical protein
VVNIKFGGILIVCVCLCYLKLLPVAKIIYHWLSGKQFVHGNGIKNSVYWVALDPAACSVCYIFKFYYYLVNKANLVHNFF